jgi:hypothetical protein
MSLQDIISLINGVGFPIFVSVYLLLSTNKLIQANTDATNLLKDEITKMNITK